MTDKLKDTDVTLLGGENTGNKKNLYIAGDQQSMASVELCASMDYDYSPGQAVLDTGLDKDLDFSQYRVDQDSIAAIGGEQILSEVGVRKPNAEEFFTICPLPGYCETVHFMKVKEERDKLYIVVPRLQPEVDIYLKAGRVHVVLNKQGNIFLWVISMDVSGGGESWINSAELAVSQATKGWIKMVSNMTKKAYDVYRPEAQWELPDWGKILDGKSFGDLFKIAFRDRVIREADHPVLKRLRGTHDAFA